MSEQETELRYDYRIIEVFDPDFDNYIYWTVAAVTYNDDNSVAHHIEFESFNSIESAFKFVDQLYAASIKPVLIKNKDGSYE